jgi:ankyrin repeat protein
VSEAVPETAPEAVPAVLASQVTLSGRQHERRLIVLDLAQKAGKSAGMCGSDLRALQMLCEAAERGAVAGITNALAGGVPVDARSSKTGWTALHRASDRGRAEAVTALIAAGADLSKCTTSGGDTPLHLAAANGHAAVVKVLCDAGAVRRTPSPPAPRHHSPSPANVTSKWGSRRVNSVYDILRGLGIFWCPCQPS